MKNFNKIFAYAIFMFQIVHCTLNIDNCKAQWVQTNGPFGGNIYSFASKGNDNFCGSYLGGVYRTTNYGDSWIPAGLIGKWIYHNLLLLLSDLQDLLLQFRGYNMSPDHPELTQ